MPTIPSTQLALLQRNTDCIRNICILAHVDHGKTTLSDSLLATNGIISNKLAGKVRYLDSREDEQERGITMESSAISLLFKLIMSGNGQDSSKEYLINLIDSPGHVDFATEVSTASRLCDGALVLIDVVEGVCTQTISVLRQAWIDKVKPILVLNKMDRFITELKLTPSEAYTQLNRILEQVNAVMASFFTGDLMEEEARKTESGQGIDANTNDESLIDNIFDWSIEERDDSDIYFDPSKGNVIFASAIDGWAFRVHQFATIYADKIGFSDSVLKKCLWGDYYFDPKTKRVIQQKHLKGRALKPMFVQFVLENIWAIYNAVLVDEDKDRTAKIVQTLGIRVLPRDLRSRDTQALLSLIFSQWLPLSRSVLLAIIGQIPPPKIAQQIRLPKILHPQARYDDELKEPSNDVEKALYTCDTSESAPVVAYVSKMFAVPDDLLPENRRTCKEVNTDQVRSSSEYNSNIQKEDGSENATDKNTIHTSSGIRREHLIGFARLYSGKIRIGQKLFVLGPKYDPSQPHKYSSEIIVQGLYLIMGRELEELQEVSAGNVFGIAGLEGHVLRNGTLASQLDHVNNMAGVSIEAAPIVRVALEPEDPADTDKLVEGLRMLNQADPCVEVMLQETGEHVILTAGELHLERCLRDLKERFAKVNIQVSEPIVPFRETIIVSDLSLNKSHDNPTTLRGTIKITTPDNALMLCVRVVPLPPRISSFLEKHTTTIKLFVDRKLSKSSKGNAKAESTQIDAEQVGQSDPIMSFDEFYDTLRREFLLATKERGPNAHIWVDIMDRIWAFGPKRIGPNILVNGIPGYARKSFFQAESALDETTAMSESDGLEDITVLDPKSLLVIGISDVDLHIHTGFQISTNSGPLCAEPVTGVCYIVQDVKVNEPSHPKPNDGTPEVRSRLGAIQGQVISTMKEACRKGFLDWSPRLRLAMYTSEIQASAEVLGRVYGVISKRKGKIISEDLKDGTQLWQIRATIPVVESFGFSDEIRKRTSGSASPLLVFSGFDILDQDPFWVPTTEEELEDLGEKADKDNLAKKYMDKVRLRKGMFVEKKLIEHAEKQRTLKK